MLPSRARARGTTLSSECDDDVEGGNDDDNDNDKVDEHESCLASHISL